MENDNIKLEEELKLARNDSRLNEELRRYASDRYEELHTIRTQHMCCEDCIYFYEHSSHEYTCTNTSNDGFYCTHDSINPKAFKSIFKRIKKCPLCNGKASYIDNEIVCNDCGLSIKGTSKKDVFRKWNQRYCEQEFLNLGGNAALNDPFRR